MFLCSQSLRAIEKNSWQLKLKVFYFKSYRWRILPGAWAAHKAVAIDAKENHFSRVLVFEDDFSFTENFVSSFADYLQSLHLFLDLNYDWEYFLLGHNPFAMKATGLANIVKTRSWGMLAYAMSSTGISKLSVAVYPHAYGETIDGIVFASSKSYAFFPMLVHHSPNFSFTTRKNRTSDMNHVWQTREKLLHNAANDYFLCFPSFATYDMTSPHDNLSCNRLESSI